MIKLLNCKWNELPENIRDKRLYCFGAGNQAEWLSYEICQVHLADQICAFIDNDAKKQGSCVRLDGVCIPVISFEQFITERDDGTVVLITSMYYCDMVEQMDAEPSLDGLRCYIEVFLDEQKETVSVDVGNTGMQRIPKKIHYCWFGKQDIPEQYKKYMESWKKFCPDYEIIRWDESNYDYSKVNYTLQAYEAKKWAFVSDYARLDVVYQHGGIYLDVDVEVVNNLDDLLANQMFCGFEKGNCVNTGLGFGAIKGFELLKSMKEMYNRIDFVRADGTLNRTACTKYQTDFLVKKGLKRNGKQQSIGGMKVYPRTVLAPYDFFCVSDQFSDMTHTVHHYAATWFDTEQSKKRLIQKNCELRKRMQES